MTDVIHITIPGRPITKKNHGRIVNCGGKPRLLPSPQFRDYQDKPRVEITIGAMED